MNLTILLLALVASVAASTGDYSPQFQECIRNQFTQRCSSSVRLPLNLRLFLWTCEDECKYHCTHIITDEAIREGRKREQFYGKWAFWRFFGMQEPASVAFSLMNLWAHTKGGRLLKRRIPKEHPMKPFYYGFTLVNINLWIWSSLFHTRDKPWTEKMDYFSAGLGSMYGLWYTVVRLYHLYLQPRLLVHNTPSRRRLFAPWTSFCILLYLAHVTYLCLLPRFDYGWNMKVNLIIGMLYNSLWISYSLPSPPFQRFWRVPNVIRPSFVLYPAMIAISMICAVSLEIFDFPPWWRIIDAHSLWHLATVPIVWNWYRFLLKDSLDPSWRDRLTT